MGFNDFYEEDLEQGIKKKNKLLEDSYKIITGQYVNTNTQNKNLAALYKRLGTSKDDMPTFNTSQSKFTVQSNSSWENARQKSILQENSLNMPKPLFTYKKPENFNNGATENVAPINNKPLFKPMISTSNYTRQPISPSSLNSGSSYTQKPIYNNGKLSEVNYEAKKNSIGGKTALFLKDNPLTQNVFKPALYGTMQSFSNNIAAPIAKLRNQEDSINKINQINAQVDNAKNKNLLTKASGFIGNSVGDMSLYSPMAKLTGIGKLAGGVGNKVTSKLGGGALGGIAGAGAREGLENASLSAITGLGGLSSGYDSFGQYAGNVAMEGLSGAAFGGALDGLGKGTNFVKNKLDTAFDPIGDLYNIKSTENVSPQTTLRKNQARDIKPKLEAKAEIETDIPQFNEKGLDDNVIKETPVVKNIKSNVELTKGKVVSTPKGNGKVVSFGGETVVVDINGSKEFFAKNSVGDVKAKEVPKLPDLPNIDVKKELDNLDLKFTERDFYRDMADMRYKKDSILGQDEGLDDYIKEYAGMIKEDMRFGTKGGESSVNKETNAPNKSPRVQSEAFDIIINHTGASYKEISESLDRIMNGQITKTLDRKIETVLDDVLINGTRLSDGLPIPPNEGYISRKAEYETLVKDRDKFLLGENKQPNAPLESVNTNLTESSKKKIKAIENSNLNDKQKTDHINRIVSEDKLVKADNSGMKFNKGNDPSNIDLTNIDSITKTDIDIMSGEQFSEYREKMIEKHGIKISDEIEEMLDNIYVSKLQNRYIPDEIQTKIPEKKQKPHTIDFKETVGEFYNRKSNKLNGYSPITKALKLDSNSQYPDVEIATNFKNNTYTVLSGGKNSVKLADFDTIIAAESFARKYAEIKGDTSFVDRVNNRSIVNESKIKEMVDKVNSLLPKRQELKAKTVSQEVPVVRVKKERLGLDTEGALTKEQKNTVDTMVNAVKKQVGGNNFKLSGSKDGTRYIKYVPEGKKVSQTFKVDINGNITKVKAGDVDYWFSENEININDFKDSVINQFIANDGKVNQVKAKFNNETVFSGMETRKSKTYPTLDTTFKKDIAPLESVSSKQSVNTSKPLNDVVRANNGVKSELDKLEQKHKENIESIKRSNANSEIKNKRLKTEGIKYSAEKRKIAQGDSLELVDGGLTPKELQKKIDYLNSNHVGKNVITPNGNGKIVGNAFGKVQVEINGVKHTFEKGNVKGVENYPTTVQTSKPKTEQISEIKKANDEIAATNMKENEKLSRNANITAQQKSILSDETKKRIRGTTYEATTEKENLEWGIKEVEFRGVDEAVTRYMEGNYKDKEATMVGAILREELDGKGRYKEADKVARKLSEDLSTAGQTIQAVAQFNKQTPSGMLDTARKTVKDIQEKVLDKPAKKTAFDDLNKKLGNGEITQEQFYKQLDKEKIPYLTDEQQKQIFDMQTRVKALEKEIQTVTSLLEETNNKDTKQIEDLRNVINYLVSEQEKTIAKREKVARKNIQKSNFEKFQNYRYMSMLFNTKTLLARNPLASLTRMVTDAVGNPLGVAIDKSLSNKTGVRTRYKNDYSGTGKTIGKSFSNMKYDFINGTNISNNNPNNVDFKEGSKGLIGKSFQYAMNLGDVPFADVVNNAQVRGYMKEKGLSDISQVPKEILELAYNKGKENNFQNKNKLTPWINKGKELPVVGQVLDATMPFVNTSMNIVQDGYERSPLGLINGLVDLARVNSKHTKKTDIPRLQKSAVDKITKGTVGLGTTGLGYLLGDSFTDGYDKDSKVAEAEKTAGKRANSLQVGDYDFDLSQLSTLAPNLQLGSFLKKNGINSKNIGKGIGEQLSTSLESSPFSGLQSFLEDLSDERSDNKVFDAGVNLVGNYANQLIPTQLKYLNNSIDDTRRDTYSENPVKRQINTLQSNIPMLSKMLPAQVDILGNEKKKYPNMNGLEAAINSNWNPLLTSKSGGENQRQLNNIVKVGKETGSGTHIPQLYSKKILGNDLTKEQLNDYKKYYGEYSKNATKEEHFKEALERAEKRIISQYGLKKKTKK